MKTLWASLVLALAFVSLSDALKCYQCDSTTNPDCEENFDWDHVEKLSVEATECTVDKPSYCIKTTGVWGGVVGTKRFCSSRDMFNQCQYIKYPDHDRIYRACIYTCSGDGCNSAPRPVTLSLTALYAAALLTLLQRLL